MLPRSLPYQISHPAGLVIPERDLGEGYEREKQIFRKPIEVAFQRTYGRSNRFDALQVMAEILSTVYGTLPP